jgi:hypothetical protein
MFEGIEDSSDDEEGESFEDKHEEEGGAIDIDGKEVGRTEGTVKVDSGTGNGKKGEGEGERIVV